MNPALPISEAVAQRTTTLLAARTAFSEHIFTAVGPASKKSFVVVDIA